MNCELCIRADEVMADIRSAAWLEQELHSDLDRHRRHQMADICEPDNVERVWRVLAIGIAEIRLSLLKILKPRDDLIPANELERPSGWQFTFRHGIAPDVSEFLKEKIHEYLVAKVMADRTAVIIPQCAAIWRDRAAEALAALTTASAVNGLRPVRRPLWPM